MKKKNHAKLLQVNMRKYFEDFPENKKKDYFPLKMSLRHIFAS